MLRNYSKKTIMEMLAQGWAVRYDTITAEVRLVDDMNNTVGSVRFDTYLNLCKEPNIVRARRTFSHDYWMMTKEEQS